LLEWAYLCRSMLMVTKAAQSQQTNERKRRNFFSNSRHLSEWSDVNFYNISLNLRFSMIFVFNLTMMMTTMEAKQSGIAAEISRGSLSIKRAIVAN
jgi:hypothetical protein